MSARPPLAARTPALLLVLALIVVGALGSASTNVGQHWDEVNVTDSVKNSLVTGLLLPRWYNYPSATYDIALVTSLPHVAANAAHPDSAALVHFLTGPAFTLELRQVFFLLCTLSGLAVFLLARRLTGSGWSALFAALVGLGSWEFFYQAKWVAPDALLMMWVAFALWSQHRLLVPGADGRRAGALLPALLAGVCAATKYPGGLVLLSLLAALALAPRREGEGHAPVLRRMAAAVGLALLAFVLVSPGCVLEPWLCISNLIHERLHYATGHGGYTVHAGWDHFARLATYLGVVFLAAHPLPAALAVALALVGAMALLRTQPRTALWLLALPVPYVIYMCTQRVMIVRNELLLLPVLAVLAGVGLAALLRAAGGRVPVRIALAALAVALVAFDLGIELRAAASVRSPGTGSQREALARRIAAAPGTKFVLSPACRALLASDSTAHTANVVTSIAGADRMIFLTGEVKDWQQLAANRPWRYHTVWSRMEDVNWDYYPTWVGSPRMLEVSTSDREAVAR